MAQILLLEDEASFRRLLTSVLEEAGHQVFEARDSTVGMELFRQRPIDVVITDIFMPFGDGIEALMQLRAAAPRVKVIAMSGGRPGSNTDFLRLAKDLGADRVLQKPFNPLHLAGLIDELLTGRADGD